MLSIICYIFTTGKGVYLFFNMGWYFSQAGHKLVMLLRMTLTILTRSPKARTVTTQLIYAVLGINPSTL